jgi:hypothetical protein
MITRSDYLVTIPDTGWEKLREILDKNFPHCEACGGRFQAEIPLNLNGNCQDCTSAVMSRD